MFRFVLAFVPTADAMMVMRGPYAELGLAWA
jgi:hypothetical protein